MAGLKDTIVKNCIDLEKDWGTGFDEDIAESKRWVEAMKKGRIIFYKSQQQAETGLKNIDWTGGHINHQEWPAQLNRFPWLRHLAAIYAETRDEVIAKIAHSTIDDWINSHNYSSDEHPSKGDSVLSLSVRLGQGGKTPGWWGTVPHFSCSSFYNEHFIERMLKSTQEQLECLMSHMSVKGNWRISELICLLYCGLVLPDFEKYLHFAVRHLNEAFHRQIQNDGSHEEHNPSYHFWMRDIFTQLWKLSKARPGIGLCIDTERAVRMWDYSVYSTAPDGSEGGGIHDGVLYNKRCGQMEKRDEFLKEALLYDNKEYRIEKKPSKYFPDAGQLFLRENWKSESSFVTFDATRYCDFHCHLSRLGVNYYSGSRMLLCDPGYFTYEMSNPFGPYGKSTPAHNTINLEGFNQSEDDPHVNFVHIYDDISVISASYEGGYYAGKYTWGWKEGRGTGIYGKHSRLLLWLTGKYALVFDVIESDGSGQSYKAHWQFPVGPYRLDDKNKRAWTASGTDNIMVQCLQSSSDMEYFIHEGEKDPILGWLPFDGISDFRPAPLFAMEGKAKNRREDIVTLLFPFKGDTPTEFSIKNFGCGIVDNFSQVYPVYAYHFTWNDQTEDIIACTQGMKLQVGEIGSLDSDGSLVVISLDHGRLKSALLVDGMFVSFNGSKIVDKPVSGTYFIKF
jgi:hypothetical protein